MSQRKGFKADWPRHKNWNRSYSPAVKKGNMLFLSGMGSVSPEGKVLWPGDIVKQTRQTYENIGVLLKACGASFDDVVKTIDYVAPVGLEKYRETAEVRREFFKEPFPAATGVVVDRLIRKGMLIEIDVVAVVE